MAKLQGDALPGIERHVHDLVFLGSYGIHVLSKHPESSWSPSKNYTNDVFNLAAWWWFRQPKRIFVVRVISLQLLALFELLYLAWVGFQNIFLVIYRLFAGNDDLFPILRQLQNRIIGTKVLHNIFEWVIILLTLYLGDFESLFGFFKAV